MYIHSPKITCTICIIVLLKWISNLLKELIVLVKYSLITLWLLITICVTVNMMYVNIMTSCSLIIKKILQTNIYFLLSYAFALEIKIFSHIKIKSPCVQFCGFYTARTIPWREQHPSPTPSGVTNIPHPTSLRNQSSLCQLRVCDTVSACVCSSSHGDQGVIDFTATHCACPHHTHNSLCRIH